MLAAMGQGDSIIDGVAMARARVLLTLPRRADSVWPALGAATALALSSLAFATAMILAPPLAKAPAADGEETASSETVG